MSTSNLNIEKACEFFARKVPFGSNRVMLEKALRELNLETTPFEKIDKLHLTKKLVDIHNEPIKHALEEHALDLAAGNPY